MRINHSKFQASHWGWHHNFKERWVVLDLGRHAWVITW